MSLDLDQRQSPLAALDLDALLAHRDAIREREEQLSYWRRMIQGRLDILADRLDEPTGADRSLAEVLGVNGQVPTRVSYAEVRDAEPMPELAPAERDWEVASSSDDPAVLRHAVGRLTRCERWLSQQRADVLRQLDAATAELSRRVADDPDDYLRTVRWRWLASAG